MLYRSERGRGDTVVLVHGFTQTHRSWGPLADRLAARHRVVAVDVPGHGRSAGADTGLWESADLIGAAGGRGTYIGYSLGGRLALHLALSRPELVAGLVLISTSAGIDDPAERAARVEADEVLARRAETEGVEAFVEWWLSLPMWASLPPGAAGTHWRMENTPSGLASSLRRAGQGRVDPPLWDRLGHLTMPVLILAGALDGPYTERARRLGDAIAGSSVVIVPGAGHACHLERPQEVGDAIAGWMEAQRARPTTRRAPNSS